jgi:hypothetical protein
LSGLGKNVFPDLALGQYRDDGHLLKTGGGGFFELFFLMMVDQAGWHVSQKLTVPENMRLIRLPPRSPELNPAEPIREELREKNFANKACRDLDEVEDNLCRGSNDLAKDPDKLRSMTNFPYLNVTF